MTTLHTTATRPFRQAALTLALTLAMGCAQEETDAPAGTATTAFTGATVWDGTGSEPIPDATILVRDGRVVSVSSGEDTPDQATVVDLSGRYVIPGLIDAHGHANGIWAGPGTTDPEGRVREGLETFAYYGVTTLNSLGDDDAVRAIRDGTDPEDPNVRLTISGPVITETDAEGAATSARARAAEGVDWLKLRVDDNLGTGAKMPWEAVQAVFEVAEETDLPMATHLFYLDDARRLLEMGTGMVAHSVRDRDVDTAFVEALRASGACYVPTLTREVSTFVYGARPDFFDDPFFMERAHGGELERVSDPAYMERTAASPTAAGYRAALEVALRNVKTLVDAGLPVAMGTDAGPAGRFPGYFEHLELWMMVDAGITPEQALLSATSVAAGCIGRNDVGTLEEGRWADFLVLTEDPLTDIRATRSLDAVYIGGASAR